MLSSAEKKNRRSVVMKFFVTLIAITLRNPHICFSTKKNKRKLMQALIENSKDS